MVSSELLDAGCFPAADRSMGRPDPHEDGPVGGCERGQDEALTAEDVHDGGLGEVVGACRRGWWRRGRIRWRRGRRRFRWRRRRGRFRWGWFGCGHRWWRFGCGRRWGWFGCGRGCRRFWGRRWRVCRRRGDGVGRRGSRLRVGRCRCRCDGAVGGRRRAVGCGGRTPGGRRRAVGCGGCRWSLRCGGGCRRGRRWAPGGAARRRLPEGQARRRRLLPRTRRKPRGSPWWL